MALLIALAVGLGIILVLALWFFAIYNGLVRLRQEVKNSWAQIDVQLKRRHDLIPNLVETVKGYAGHEKSTLEEVVKARLLHPLLCSLFAHRERRQEILSLTCPKLIT